MALVDRLPGSVTDQRFWFEFSLADAPGGGLLRNRALAAACSVQGTGLRVFWPLVPRGCLICSSCSSGQRLASGFLHIPPRDGHPCLPLTALSGRWRTCNLPPLLHLQVKPMLGAPTEKGAPRSERRPHETWWFCQPYGIVYGSSTTFPTTNLSSLGVGLYFALSPLGTVAPSVPTLITLW